MDVPVIFRVDDISVNTNLAALLARLEFLRSHFPDAEFLLAISPLCVDMRTTGTPERLFPKDWTPRSDRRDFYRLNACGLPDLRGLPTHQRAAHGLIHVDHRLLSRDAQELSILVSCSLVGTATFIPPFNYWNADTAAICEAHAITLIRYEDGWRHLKHEPRGTSDRMYFHCHDTTLADLEAWCS